MPSRLPLPPFAQEPWYADPHDPRCPRDASLDAVEIRESGLRLAPAAEEPAAITLKLLGASHGSRITLVYQGVTRHTLTRYQCDQGVGQWLRDEFAVTDAGRVEHRITWHSAAGGTSHWLIEAEKVSYTWAGGTGR